MSDIGRSAESIVEDEYGSVYHRALALHMLGSELDGVEAEFAYDTEEPAQELLRLVRDLQAHLMCLGLTEKGVLTLKRECECCSGIGTYNDAEVTKTCEECEGDGYTLVARERSTS